MMSMEETQELCSSACQKLIKILGIGDSPVIDIAISLHSEQGRECAYVHHDQTYDKHLIEIGICPQTSKDRILEMLLHEMVHIQTSEYDHLKHDWGMLIPEGTKATFYAQHNRAYESICASIVSAYIGLNIMPMLRGEQP